MDAKKYSEPISLVHSALQHEQNKDFVNAYDCYIKASDLLERQSKLPDVTEEERNKILDRSDEYLTHAKTLGEQAYKAERIKLTEMFENCHLMPKSSLSSPKADVRTQFSNCIEAVESFNRLKITSLFQDYAMDEDNETFKIFARLAIKRGEELNKVLPASNVSSSSSSTSGAASRPQQTFTSSELDVLRYTSNINGRRYVPFIAQLDENVNFHKKEYRDPDGLLALSEKQQRSFLRWVRPKEFMHDPKMIVSVSSEAIKQTVITDCSFLASMAIAADYERHTGKRLITKIIYPQSQQGQPLYNPDGVYMIKLHINGVPRRIFIDDFLPMSTSNELLCSYSHNPNELWVSYLEKAYMKVMGGYDFPGSSSNIDLHALTGWIPERIAIRPGTVQFNKEREFERLLASFQQRKCLITIATGALPDAEAERAGLVPSHAYAMLDMQKLTGDLKLLKLKNPWSHQRWRGNYSAHDERHWTGKLAQLLKYDIEKAKRHDDGIFWIDYESICHFFDVICVNWDPRCFPYQYQIHAHWPAQDGPKKDGYCAARNPQFRLDLSTSQPNQNIWVLLTRHITDKDDFANNREFIGLAVYKNVKSRKIYYPNEPEAWMDSQRINSPQCLVKMVERDPGKHEYILLVSQYEKTTTIRYTLTVYSDVAFRLTQIKDPWSVNSPCQVTSKWNENNAGGCPNHPDSYEKNPRFELKIDNNLGDNQLLIELKAARELSIGIELISVQSRCTEEINKFKRLMSGDYRRGYAMLELAGVSGGTYHVVPSTFRPGQQSAFFLSISCTSKDFSVKSL